MLQVAGFPFRRLGKKVDFFSANLRFLFINRFTINQGK